MYGYVLNDPINFIDPSRKNIWGAVVGIAVYFLAPDLFDSMDTNQKNSPQERLKDCVNNTIPEPTECPSKARPADSPFPKPPRKRSYTPINDGTSA